MTIVVGCQLAPASLGHGKPGPEVKKPGEVPGSSAQNFGEFVQEPVQILVGLAGLGTFL
jgi:hypothetical protein